MDTRDNSLDSLFDFTEDIGETKDLQQLGEGVYCISLQQPAKPICSEYYVVLADSPVISPEAKAYGESLPGHPGLLMYLLEDPHTEYMIVRYELYRHYVRNHIPLPDGETLRSAALTGMECHPEYFGSYPVPSITPHGLTVRHRSLANGVYWIETDQAVQMLAVTYPLWDGLSDMAQRLANLLPHDLDCGIENTLGYMFFEERASSVPIFELLGSYPVWTKSGLVDKPALMNAIWQDFPEYTVIANGLEQSGVNDIVGSLLNEMGANTERNVSPEHLISISPDVGTSFLRFPADVQRHQ